jgi:hypothetical protein
LVLKEIRINFVGLRFSPLCRRNRGNRDKRRRLRDRSNLIRRQINVEYADIANRPSEPKGPASRANAYRIWQFTTRITNPIEQNLQPL